jgi:glycosyltransferase involved in cell wall biosynthesis
MKILVITPFNETDWQWFGKDFAAPECEWTFVNLALFGKRPWSWLFGALGAAESAGNCDVVISHHPYMTFYLTLAFKLRGIRKPHYAFSFNHGNGRFFKGLWRVAAVRLFRALDGVVVFSEHEKRIYGDYYGIPVDKFGFVHWAVKSPEIDGLLPEYINARQPYICCMGRNNRDFSLFIEAVRKLRIAAIVVCKDGQIDAADVPDNVLLLQDIPLKEAMQILAHSRFSVVPLKDASTGAGHITIVSAMQLGIPQVITILPTVSDYFIDGVHGIFVAQGSFTSLENAISELWNDAPRLHGMSHAASEFAKRWFGEEASKAHLRECLSSIQSCGRVPDCPPGWQAAGAQG